MIIGGEKLTRSGALTSSVITRTRVPPTVHQTLKELIRLIALVPIVLTIPDAKFTPQTMPVISILVNDVCCPISIRKAMHNAALEMTVGSEYMQSLK